MKRTIAGSVLAVALAAILGACDGGGDPTTPVSGGSGPGEAFCGQFASCASCTPQNGCGWCFSASGGQCVSDPDQCAFSNNNEFTWTWNPSGCPDVDASVGAPASLDAGWVEASSPYPEAAAPEGAAPEAAVEAGAPSPADAAGAPDDAPS